MGGRREGELEQQAMAAPAPGREKSNFAVTCNLLSQYLKEKKGGQLLHGALAMAPPPAGAGVSRPPPTTMNLLSALDVPAEPKDADTAEPRPRASDSVQLYPEERSTTEKTAAPEAPTDSSREDDREEAQQLTIFYGGKVAVFDSFPAVKVKDLLQMVSGGHGAADKAASGNTAPLNLPTHAHKLSDMPIARRNSLHRFLEKRKGRVTAKAPYHQGDASAQASDKQATGDKSWLGLGQEVTVSIKREI